MRASRLFVAILVLVAIVVLPGHIALAQAPPPDPTRSLPDKVERGATFDVIVNFTCPADDFNGINLRDTAPDGWNVTVDQMWCDPDADGAEVFEGNQARLVWIGPYFLPEDENFTAKYEVTVPCGASLGNHSFSVDYPAENMLRWKTGDLSTINSTIITGDYVLEVIGPTINFAPTSIDFYGAVNGTNPQDQTLELWSSTSCWLNWNVTDDANYTVTGRDWLSENGENITSGNCNYTEHSFVVLSVNTSGMPEGEYFANITINSSEANNPQEIVPVTLHMSVTDVLEAHVNFVGRGEAPDDRWIEPFEVWLFNPGTTQVVWQGNRTTNNTGWFNISDVPVGTYDIGIKNWTCLSEVVPVTVSEGAGGLVDFGTTREGDANNDDWVTMADLSTTLLGWGTQEGDSAYSIHYDFNRDGWVTMADLSVALSNWGQYGDLVG